MWQDPLRSFIVGRVLQRCPGSSRSPPWQGSHPKGICSHSRVHLPFDFGSDKPAEHLEHQPPAFLSPPCQLLWAGRLVKKGNLEGLFWGGTRRLFGRQAQLCGHFVSFCKGSLEHSSLSWFRGVGVHKKQPHTGVPLRTQTGGGWEPACLLSTSYFWTVVRTKDSQL